MTRVGAIDCGTNSIRLLIADVDQLGRLVDVVRRTEVVRLGYGVDRTGVIDPVAMERTLVQTREYAAQCREHAVERVRFVATSASRDASNAAEFVLGVESAFAAAGFDVSPEVVSGEAEANLSFTGATGDLVAADIPGPYLVIDLGGGSTEFVRGTGQVESARSVDIGCVRISERHLTSDPATDEQIAAARADITAAIDRAEEVVDLSGIATVVGLAGSITTITAHALGLTAYAPDLIHLAHLTPAAHRESAQGLLHATTEERAELGYMHPGRVDVIGAGALVWHEILGRVLERSPDAQVVTSEHDILDGIALSCAG
ncbi:putative exopolyphosphatase [Janibacter sp. HTCC2649]|uniref:Ppx/GppA phosphatase family protein n=1 Tax=Janibacter sp. HTCC2649 TaxID=313589 RepID=UPI0000671065|nr:exopolyphosphatase [Janibacter sp. HTCC2649]EAP97229.1 putative exopolyphosphatase [Janibacter sp. HTCC2649]